MVPEQEHCERAAWTCLQSASTSWEEKTAGSHDGSEKGTEEEILGVRYGALSGKEAWARKRSFQLPRQKFRLSKSYAIYFKRQQH